MNCRKYLGWRSPVLVIIVIDKTKLMTMDGIRKMEVELDGQELESLRICVPQFNSANAATSEL